MMNRRIRLFTLVATLVAGVARMPADEVVTRVLPRSRPDRLYELTIQLPPSFQAHPERKYPVIFVADGYWGFGTVNNICGGLGYGKHLPEVLVVGLGYAGENLDYSQMRGDDLSPQEGVAGITGGGHARKFLELIETQAIPLLEKEFRADPGHRFIVGSSAGGLFALYAFFTKPELFEGYVADSPAIGRLWNLEREFAAAKRTTGARVYVSVAENEPASYRREIQAFYGRMAKHGYVKGGLMFRRIDGVRHSAGTSESYMQGLRFVAAAIAPEHGVQTDALTDLRNRPRFVVFFRPAHGDTTAAFGPSDAASWDVHRDYLRQLGRQNKIEYALVTPADETSHDSVLSVFADNQSDADALAREDPAVKSGLLTYEIVVDEE